MDGNDPVLEKHACDGSSGSHGHLSPVSYRECDRFDPEDIRLVCPMLLEAKHVVNDEDLSRIVTYQVKGQEIRLPEVEATLYAYFTYGCQVRLALQNDELVGIMIYLRVFDDTIAIRLNYVIPTHRKKRVAHDLVDSLTPKPNTILFQTRKGKPPLSVHECTETRRWKLSQGEYLENWAMQWGGS